MLVRNKEWIEIKFKRLCMYFSPEAQEGEINDTRNQMKENKAQSEAGIGNIND